MKFLKSHFWYNKRQRNGVLFLLTIIVVLQGIYAFFNFSSNNELLNTNSLALNLFKKQIDSLKSVEIERRKPKIYPFNPNYISDFKGYKLGMSTDEIDRLHKFREQNKWINSAKQFKQVTKVSDSIFNQISPYFKFPDWVVKKNKSKNLFPKKREFSPKKNYKSKEISTTNINKATAQDFATIYGIGEKLSQRIIKYRKRLQGFSYDYQLYEVWNIDPEIIKKLLQTFTIIEKPIIEKVNVNTASFKEVLKNPYIDYELCKKIFNYRDEVAELQNISELKKIEGFPLEKYDRITLYLEAK